MRKHPYVMFVIIVLITIIAAIIVLPREIPMHFSTPPIPFINKPISVDRTIYTYDPNTLLRQFGLQRDFTFRKGLDLEGGTSITLQANMEGVPQDQRDEALESAKRVVERRVNLFGVSEPVVQTSRANNEYRIIVELAGVTDVNQALNVLGTTAQLSFWEEGATESAQQEQASPSAGIPPPLYQVFSSPEKTDLTGKDLREANVTFDQQTGQPQVQLLFTSEGAKKFADITRRNVNQVVAIVLDDQIIQAPRVNQVITGGDAVITGGFTAEQARELSIQLKAGALPIPLAVIQQRTIGPTLGIVSLQKSLFAGILGFLIIILFMVFLYKKLGVVASIALLLYSIYVLAIFKLIPVTLTLAGIAGFILSVGMAVDANILIFERMKEELRRGRNRDMALELGFSRAWSSIRDSNIATLIITFILYQFGTGLVRGFAVTLAIGVLVSMFSAIVVTRTFLRIMNR